MKKLFVIALCLLVVLSLAACGEEEKEPTAPIKGENQDIITDVVPDDTQPQQPQNAEPNEEEMAVLDRYFTIAWELESYMAGYGFNLTLGEGENYYNMSDDAIAFLVKELKAMEVVDKFANSQYCLQKTEGVAYPVSWNRQDYLSKFKVLKADVLVKQETERTDHVGNVTSGSTVKPWKTANNTLGFSVENLQLVEKTDTANGNQNFVYFEIYDEAGKLEKVEYYHDNSDTIALVRIPEYDANGLRIKDTVTNSSGYAVEVFYAYDQQNRLIQIKWEHYQWDFVYDDKGNQAIQVFSIMGNNGVTSETIWEYTFDEQGRPISAAETLNDYSIRLSTRERYLDRQAKNQHTFTYDEQGRILTWETVPGDEYYMYGNNAGKVYKKAGNKLITYTFTYGDLMRFEYEQN